MHLSININNNKMKITKKVLASIVLLAAFTACQNNASEDDLLKVEKQLGASGTEVADLKKQIEDLVNTTNATQAEIDAAEQALADLSDKSDEDLAIANTMIEGLVGQEQTSAVELGDLLREIAVLTTPVGEIPNFSNLDALVTMDPAFSAVKVSTLISTSDALTAANPIAGRKNFKLAGAADGAGFIKDGSGYILAVNCEDDYAVARIKLDANLKPIEGDYLLNSGVADFARQCSGTMWEKDIHGGDKDLFLSASESFNYDVKAIDPRVEVPTPTADFGLDALGEFSWENATPLPRDTYPGATVIIGGDDDSSNSEGQVTLYYSTAGDADFEGGKIYVLKLKEISNGTGGKTVAVANTQYDESNLDFGIEYDVEFVEVVDGAAMTKDEMEEASNEVLASQFMRVEDVDYQKGAASNALNVYFAVTGRGPGRGTYNDWGTAYKLELDAANPLSGRLTQIISGNTDTNNNDGNLAELQSPDNITVTENYIYLQEDPNSFDRGHAAYIYQTDLAGNTAKVVLELIVRQDLDPTGETGLSGEFGALVDISDKVGIADTFMLCLQPHYWESSSFQGLDGHDISALPECVDFCREDDQGSQIVILSGLPR